MMDVSLQDTLRTEALCKDYGRRRVVNKVNLQVKRGEIVALLGPNGAGKTSTFYMIVGLVKPTSGEVVLGNEAITQLPMYKRSKLGIGYLPQEPSTFRKLTVRENILAIAETLKLDSDSQEKLVQSHLKELHLDHLANQKAFTLSGGERRRLEISRALVTSPSFLLLDEPFSGVDPISVQEVQNIIKSLKQKNIGIIITDHNVRETLRVVDRAYLLHNGEILCEGTSDFLVNDAKSRELYLGSSFNL